MSYPIEVIGSEQKLFYRIHKVNVDESISDPILRIRPAAFNPQPVSQGSVQMSVNWEKYSTAETTKNSAARNPHLNGVLSFISNQVRSSPVNLDVTHSPTKNRSHSHIHDVVSEKNDPEIRLHLREICSWEIEIE